MGLMMSHAQGILMRIVGFIKRLTGQKSAFAGEAIVKEKEANFENNKSIKSFLDYYTKNKNLDYAVFLDGNWGTGKTYFIKNYIKNNKENFIYVSLYGISQKIEIDEIIFNQAIAKRGLQFVESEGFKAIKSCFSKLIEEKIPLDFNAARISITDRIIKDKIVIFDDFERCEIGVTKTLGYINHLVEHEGLRAIIIGNEKEIDDSSNKNSKYSKTRERLIGKTFSIKPEIDSAISSFLKNIEYERARSALKRNISIIQEKCALIDCENLRTIKTAMFEFERLFKILPEEAKKIDRLIIEIIQDLVFFTYEMSKGTLDVEGIKKVPEVYRGISNEPEKKIIYEKHRLYGLWDSFPSIELWYDFFKYGIIDSDKLEKSFKSSQFYPKKQEEWINLWHWKRAEDEELKKSHKEVIEKLGKLEYKKAGELLHIAGILMSLSENGIIQEPIASIKDRIIKICEELNNNNTLDFDGLEDSTYRSLGFHSPDKKEFKDIENVLKIYKGEKNEEVDFPEKAKNALESIKQGSIALKATGFYPGGVHGNFPLLKYINAKDFVQAFLDCPNGEKANILKTLFENRHIQLIEKEYENLKEVIKIIDEKSTTPLLEFHLGHMKRYLENLLQSIPT